MLILNLLIYDLLNITGLMQQYELTCQVRSTNYFYSEDIIASK